MADLILEVFCRSHVAEKLETTEVIASCRSSAWGLSILVPNVEQCHSLVSLNSLCKASHLIWSEILQAVVSLKVMKLFPLDMILCVCSLD
jgi:hypothetical protein